MASSCFDCVLCKRGTLPRARRCLSSPGNSHLLTVLQSCVPNGSTYSFNTVDRNSWLCRPCSRTLEQLQSARERAEILEADIRRRLAVEDSQDLAATRTPERAVASSPLREQHSSRQLDSRTTEETGTVTRRNDTPTRSALERMVPSASSPAVTVSLLSLVQHELL